MASVRIISVGPLQGSSTQTSQHFLGGGNSGVGQLCSGTSFQKDRPPLFLKVWVGVVCLWEEVWKLYKSQSKGDNTPSPDSPTEKDRKRGQGLGSPQKTQNRGPQVSPKSYWSEITDLENPIGTGG